MVVIGQNRSVRAAGPRSLAEFFFVMVKKHSTQQVTDTSQVLEKVRVHMCLSKEDIRFINSIHFTTNWYVFPNHAQHGRKDVRVDAISDEVSPSGTPPPFHRTIAGIRTLASHAGPSPLSRINVSVQAEVMGCILMGMQ